MFIELLIAVYIEMTLYLGKPGALVVLLIAGGVAAFGAWWIANWFTLSFLGMGTSYTSTEIKERKHEQTQKEKLEALHVHDLQKYVNGHARDLLARRMLADRYKQGGDYMSYCREAEKLLNMEKGLNREQISMRHHQLADTYLGQMRNPAEARRVLLDFIDRYPDSPQARLTRKRIDRIAASMDDSEDFFDFHKNND
jgi:hypothetical protein